MFRSTELSYQVIARKYRPQTFSDLTGQEHITRTLENALDQSRVHHAYIFSGVRGTGKTTTARILAKGLNCAKGMTSKPCLSCDSCLEIAAGNSIDVQEIDAASHTQVDNVRDVIINSIAIGPARDRYKVFVLDEAHMLSTHASNALLKTIEEPPPHVFFIMATTSLHKVPDTILSRCQHFEFKQIPIEKIFQRLALIAKNENITITESALREIAQAGAGSLRDAQSALDQVIAFSGSEITDADVSRALGVIGTALLDRTTNALAARDTKMLLDSVEELVSVGYDLRNFAKELMAWLRHLLLVKSGIENAEALGVGELEAERLKDVSSRFTEADLVRCFHLLAEVEKEIKDSSFPRFSLEVGLIKLTHLLELQTLDEIVSRLEALEARLNAGAENSVQPVRTPPSSKGPDSPSKATNAPESPVVPETRKAVPVKPQASGREAAAPPRDWVPEEPPDFDDFEPVVEETRPHNADSVAMPVRGAGLDAIMAELERLGRPLVITSLEEAGSINYADGRLTVEFAKDDIFASRVRDSQVLFGEIGNRLFNRPIKVDVRIGGTVSKKTDARAEAQEGLRQRALKNPAVRMFLDKFQGEIVDVRETSEK